MSRPNRRAPIRAAYPNPSIPNDLVELYREHAARLPPMSAACAEGMRQALLAIGVEPPPPPPPLLGSSGDFGKSQ